MVSDASRGPPAAALVRQICQTCARSLPVSGAAISVMTAGGHRGVVSATDKAAASLEDVQFTVGEGPGIDAFATGRAVLVRDLEASDVPDAGAWPAYRDSARKLGVRAVFAFPLQLGAASLGALTAYHVEPGALDGPHLARAVRWSDAAAVAVLDMIVGSGPDGDGSRPSAIGDADAYAGTGTDAEFYRVEIYQAAGMLTVQLGVSIEVALMRLRSHAFAAGLAIGDVARDIVRHKLRLEADTDGTAEKT
jgi:GAF domain